MSYLWIGIAALLLTNVLAGVGLAIAWHQAQKEERLASVRVQMKPDGSVVVDGAGITKAELVDVLAAARTEPSLVAADYLVGPYQERWYGDVGSVRGWAGLIWALHSALPDKDGTVKAAAAGALVSIDLNHVADVSVPQGSEGPVGGLLLQLGAPGPQPSNGAYFEARVLDLPSIPQGVEYNPLEETARAFAKGPSRAAVVYQRDFELVMSDKPEVAVKKRLFVTIKFVSA
ncbi:MAG: hypothetical protein ACOZNI_19940 [Myxococcota bacterium]